MMQLMETKCYKAAMIEDFTGLLGWMVGGVSHLRNKHTHKH